MKRSTAPSKQSIKPNFHLAIKVANVWVVSLTCRFPRTSIFCNCRQAVPISGTPISQMTFSYPITTSAPNVLLLFSDALLKHRIIIYLVASYFVLAQTDF